MEAEILDFKIKLLQEMQKAILVMNYIKALDNGLKKVKDIKAKNYYHSEFIKQVSILRDMCKDLRRLFEEWFKLEKDKDLEIDLQLRANYKAIVGF